MIVDCWWAEGKGKTAGNWKLVTGNWRQREATASLRDMSKRCRVTALHITTTPATFFVIYAFFRGKNRRLRRGINENGRSAS